MNTQIIVGIYIIGIITYVLTDILSNKQNGQFYNVKLQYKKFKKINKDLTGSDKK